MEIDKKYMKEVFKTVLFLEYLGIHIEQIDENACYFSIPKESKLDIQSVWGVPRSLTQDKNYLIDLCKREVTQIINLNENDLKTYTFYSKERDVVWTNELADKITDDNSIENIFSEVSEFTKEEIDDIRENLF